MVHCRTCNFWTLPFYGFPSLHSMFTILIFEVYGPFRCCCTYCLASFSEGVLTTTMTLTMYSMSCITYLPTYLPSFLYAYLHKTHNTIDITNITNAKPNVILTTMLSRPNISLQTLKLTIFMHF